MKKIRILTVSTSGLQRKEGISTVILDYFRRFDRESFDLNMVAQGGCCPELAEEFAAAGIRVIDMPSRKESTKAYIAALLRLFRKERYDVLYIHGSSAIMTIELFIAWLCGCKVRVVHSHNTTCDHKKADRLLRPFFYCLLTDAMACGTEAGKWLYGGRDFRIVKNGRDVERYRFRPEVRERLRRELGLEEGTLAIGHVGNFNRQKNQSFLLDVFAELRKTEKDAKLFLMGSGELLESVRQRAQELGLTDSVTFTGSIDYVPDMLQAMDGMLLPSLHEGLPLVAVEWQIAGLPCILSDHVTKECVCTQSVQFLPLEDPARWAEKLQEICSGDRQTAAKEAELQIRQNGFDLAESAKELQSFFAKRCAER